MGDQLETEGDLFAPVVVSAATWLSQLAGDGIRRLIDLGSGPGVATCIFAQHFPDAQVVAVDSTPALLERASVRAVRLGVADRLTTLLGDLETDLETLGQADAVWASNVMHHVGDQAAGLVRLGRLVRPGGFVVLAEGRGSPIVEPDPFDGLIPGLRERFEAANKTWFAGMRTGLPNFVDAEPDWDSLLGQAGLDVIGHRVVHLVMEAPVSETARAMVRAGVSRMINQASALSHDDQTALSSLLTGDASIDNRGDISVTFTRALFVARRPCG